MKNDKFTEEQRNVLAFLLIFYSCLALDFHSKGTVDDFKLSSNVHNEVLKLLNNEEIWIKT